MYEGTTRFGELLTKVGFFQGTQELMAKLPKVQKIFRKFGKLCPFMSALNEQQLVFVFSHILKLNKAKCVHSLPLKRGLRPKPVPGRGCPSLKLRLSSPAHVSYFNLASLETEMMKTTNKSRKKTEREKKEGHVPPY